MPEMPRPGAHRQGRWANRGVWASGLLVAVGAAVATAHGLYAVVLATGTLPLIAGLYPLITDGLALVAYAATARLTGSGRRYAWCIVVLAAGSVRASSGHPRRRRPRHRGGAGLVAVRRRCVAGACCRDRRAPAVPPRPRPRRHTRDHVHERRTRRPTPSPHPRPERRPTVQPLPTPRRPTTCPSPCRTVRRRPFG